MKALCIVVSLLLSFLTSCVATPTREEIANNREILAVVNKLLDREIQGQEGADQGNNAPVTLPPMSEILKDYAVLKMAAEELVPATDELSKIILRRTYQLRDDHQLVKSGEKARAAHADIQVYQDSIKVSGALAQLDGILNPPTPPVQQARVQSAAPEVQAAQPTNATIAPPQVHSKPSGTDDGLPLVTPKRG